MTQTLDDPSDINSDNSPLGTRPQDDGPLGSRPPDDPSILGHAARLFGTFTPLVGEVTGLREGLGDFGQGKLPQMDSETSDFLEKIGLLRPLSDTWQSHVDAFNNEISWKSILNLPQQAITQISKAALQQTSTAAINAGFYGYEAFGAGISGLAGAAGGFYGGIKAIFSKNESAKEQDIQEGINTGLGMAESIPNEGAIMHGIHVSLSDARLIHASVAETSDRAATPRRGVTVPSEAPPTLPEAHDLGIIGDKPGTPQYSASGRSFIDEAREAATAAPEPEAPVQVPQDIHALARQIDPETFQTYDALQSRREAVSDQLSILQDQARARAEAAAPSAEPIETLNSRVQELTDSLDGIKNKAEQRRVRAQIRDAQSQADQLSSEREDFMDRVTRGSMIAPDTFALRERMNGLDAQLRDIAGTGKIKAAYEEAEARLPQETAAEPVAAPESVEAPQASEEAPGAVAAPESPVAEAEPTAGSVTTPEHLQYIADDVTKKLVAAGRPEAEASAAAQLVAAHYEARAERFEGAKGTAKDLYDKDGPAIQGVAAAEASAKMPEYAQTLKRGKIAFNDAKATISLFKDANASTFIHESGHHWLNEMMMDAGDPQAPDGLKADAKSVRDWLETPDGEKITRGQHEKFARGFERYMMEGRAPSPGLAGVFEKFRGWLTNIYQTVSKLRSPITDDIRAVFDRLIAKNPERQDIAETPNAAKMLADIHEADAESTAPEHAAAARDQIKPELIDAAARAGENTKEAVNVGSGRVEPGAGNAETPGGAGGEPGSALGAGEGVAAAPTEVSSSAGEAGAESVEPQQQPTELPPRTLTPEYALENDPSLFKAGNLRLDKLTNDRSIDMAIHTMAEQMNGFEDARRGIVPDSKVMELADAAGIPLDQININSFGKMMLPEKVEAARRMLVESAKDLQDKARSVNDALDSEGGGQSEMKAFSDAWDRHALIQRHLSSVSAEWGRIGRVLNRMVPGGEDAAAIKAIQAGGEMPETYFQAQRLAKMIASTDTPGQVGKLISDAQKPTWQDFVTEYYIHNLISGPVTHTKYMLHNNLLMLARPAETLIASGVGKVSELFNPDIERVHAGEAWASLTGYWNGLLPGVNAAMRALKENALPALPGELSPDLMEAGQGFLPAKTGVIPGTAGEVFRAPARLVTGIHAFTRMVAYSQEAHASAYRMAAEKGLSGDALARDMATTLVNPTPDFMQAARDEAMKQALMEPAKYDSITAQLNRITNNNLALKLIQPFINVQANILKQSYLERTPIGIALSPEVRGRVLGTEGAVAQQMQIGKMMLGGTIMTSVGVMIGQGLATGGGPADAKERAIWLAAGNQPYSIRIGDTWVSYRGGPIGTLMGAVSDGVELMARSKKEDAAKIAKSTVAAVGKNILDESNLKGFHDAIDAALNPRTLGANYIRNMAANFIPWSVGASQIARAFDPDQRHVETFGEAVQAHIPGVSQQLTPARDIFGEEIRQATALPGIYNSIQDNPMAKEMLSLGVFPGRARKEIDGVDLDEKQYDDYQRISGRYFAYRLNAYMHMPAYSSVPPQMKAEFIEKQLSDSRKQAQIYMKIQYPGIAVEAAQQRREDIKSQFAPAKTTH